MRSLGFTGTREGLSGYQRNVLKAVLKYYDEVHHGDCVGADDQFDDLAAAAGCSIIIHPPSNPKLRAYCHRKEDGAQRFVHKPLPYLDRNKDIVDDTDRTIGCPKEKYEPKPARGQGTWSAIRYARNKGKLLEVTYP